MIPDLRDKRDYPAPFPRWLLGAGIVSLAAFLGAGAFAFLQHRDLAATRADVAMKRNDIGKMKTELLNLSRSLESQEAAQRLRSSSEQWKLGTLPTTELQAGILAAVQEAEAAVASQTSAKGASAPKTTAARRRQRAGEDTVPFDLFIQSLAIDTRPALSEIEVKLEIKHNRAMASQEIVAQLSKRFSQLNPDGFSNSVFTPELRGETFRVIAAWKRM